MQYDFNTDARNWYTYRFKTLRNNKITINTTIMQMKCET